LNHGAHASIHAIGIRQNVEGAARSILLGEFLGAPHASRQRLARRSGFGFQADLDEKAF
jgi:hypothetical protein